MYRLNEDRTLDIVACLGKLSGLNRLVLLLQNSRLRHGQITFYNLANG